MKHKKHIIAVLFVLIFSIVFLNNSYAQVYNGNLILISQADVDALIPFNYTKVTGFIFISSPGGGIPTDISDLTPLSNIESIGGNLSIQGPSALTDLDGLQSLTSVGGHLIYCCSSFADKSGCFT